MAQDGLEAIAEVEQEGLQENGVDEVFDRAEQEVMSFLPEMTGDELRALCAELGVVIPEPQKGSRKLIYRFVLGYLLKIEGEDADGGKAKYVQIHTFLRQLTLNRDQAANAEENKFQPQVLAPVPHLQAQAPALQAPAQALAPQVQAVTNGLPSPLLTHRMLPVPGQGVLNKIQTSTPLKNHFPPTTTHAPPPAHALRPPPKSGSLYQLKECKIRGSIGDPGEKDKVTYYGLLSQIVEKQTEGYDDNRIVGAVINAITPGNVFKSRLEMRRTLQGKISLETLLNMLRTHFQEKSSNDIFLDLGKAVQAHDESAANYCNRMIVIRDQALSRSIEEGCQIEANYLKKRFLQSFQTGLRNGNIRNDLRECLKTEPDDDTLLDFISNAVRGEKERADKLALLKSSSFVPEVSAVQREKEDFQIKRGNDALSKMEEMNRQHQKEIVSLRADFCELKNIFKSGFSNLSNLSAVSASIPPPPPFNFAFPPPPAANNSQGSSGQSGTGIPPLFPPPAVPSAPPAPPQQQYVIPQMRGSQNGRNPSSGPPNPSSNNQSRRFTGCVACVAQNIHCPHCYCCGASDHKMLDCPARQAAAARNSLNPAAPLFGNSPGNC